MQHCQLTNLLGEACFADLDYSMFKNRAATLHHHSTLNMGKRNCPVSSWLSKRSVDEQSRLLSQAGKCGPQMRQASKQKQLAVLEEIQESLAEQQREKRAREQKQLQVKRNLADDIQMISTPKEELASPEMMLKTFWNTVLEKQKNSKHSRATHGITDCSMMQNICHCSICRYNSLPKISAPISRTTFLNKMQDRKIRHMKKKMILKKTTIVLTHQHHSSSPPWDKLWQCVAMNVFTSVRSFYPSDQIWLKSLSWNKWGWKTPSNGQEPMLLKRWTANLCSTGTSPSSEEQSVDCSRRRLGDVETEVETTAETNRACSPGSKIIMVISSFSVSIIFATNDRIN